MTVSRPIAALGISGRDLKSRASLVSERHIDGYVVDRADLDARFVVELFLDGYPAQVSRANLFDEGLCGEGVGDGCYRFVFAIDPAAAEGARLAEVRLVNTGEVVGGPIDIAIAV